MDFLFDGSAVDQTLNLRYYTLSLEFETFFRKAGHTMAA